jgi:hypothetical protein
MKKIGDSWRDNLFSWNGYTSSFGVLDSFGLKVISFYRGLPHGPEVPAGVDVMYPHMDPQAWEAMCEFYLKYYGDSSKRIFVIGINPGRFGAGTTGIPFTDPIRLQEVLGINHEFDLKPELSSRFIYQVIDAYGGAETFYRHCYFTSVSPFGFTSNGKNLNYYDLRELQDTWESFMVNTLKSQIEMGACPHAFSLGQGKNHKYLLYLNDKYQLFTAIHPLPHPRWIMQYRLKKLDEFIELYCNSLSSKICSGNGNA